MGRTGSGELFLPRQIDEQIREVTLDGHPLTLEQVVAVARHRARVLLHPEAARRIDRCRALVDVLLEEQALVYGLTTGFGRLRDKVIPPRDVAELQRNLVRSHAAGVGDPFGEDVVRAALLLRINTLARGNSGIRLLVVQQLIALLNDGLYPFVPCQGSVGASGDLAPLSHLMLVLIGDPAGRIYAPDAHGHRGERGGGQYVGKAGIDDFLPLPADPAALERLLTDRGFTFRPVVLQAKEGLALNNGTQFMAALGVLTLYDATLLLRTATLAAAMSLEAAGGVPFAFDPRLHDARPLAHQGEIAARIREAVAGSEILQWQVNSAYLNRAALHLQDTVDELAEARLALPPGDPGQDALAELGRRLQSQHQTVTSFLADPAARFAAGLSRVPAAERAAARFASPVRQQLRAFRLALGPCEGEVTSCYRQLLEPTFPSSGKAKEHLARALGALEKAEPSAPPFQDNYSLRCIPQVLACTARALSHTEEVFLVEINSATDNPLLFPPLPPDGESLDGAAYRDWLRADPTRLAQALGAVIGGGNFHGEPLAVTLDYLAITLAELGSLAERRVALLVDEDMSNGLPAFLVWRSGLNSGLMVIQYTAAALVSENKVLCHPASVDSIPTCANSEDHVSMGAHSARKCREVLRNVEKVVAIELLTATQALSFRRPLQPGRRVRQLLAFLEQHGLHAHERDRVIAPDVHEIVRLLRRGDLPELAS